jgi:hypothetical protein
MTIWDTTITFDNLELELDLDLDLALDLALDLEYGSGDFGTW